MGIGDNMRGFVSNVQVGVKSTSLSAFHFSLRLVTGLFVGLTMALIGQELMGYETLALIFAIVVVLSIIIKILSPWSISQILIFDLIVVLLAMLMRMYILVAP
jgi:hypothetical protein